MNENNELPMMEWIYKAYQKSMQVIFDEALEDSPISAFIHEPESNYHFSIAKIIFRWDSVDNDGRADLSAIRYIKAYEASEFTADEIVDAMTEEITAQFNEAMSLIKEGK